MSQSISSSPAAALGREVLDGCLAGQPCPEAALDRLLGLCLEADAETERAVARALFGIVVEGLADRFEPRLSAAYADVFSRAIARALPELDVAALRERYGRVCAPPTAPLPERVDQVCVLSRVTLGADIAITSVLLDAAMRRFPNARVCLAGSRKAWELFAGDPRVGFIEVNYPRNGTLRERLAPWGRLREIAADKGMLVLDPDSRLSQLGLLPFCPEERYRLFDSRSYGRDGDECLARLAERWARETLGVAGAKPFIAPAVGPPGEAAAITMSLGIGENPAKMVPPPFEAELVAALARTGRTILIDEGGGGEETERVRRAVAVLDRRNRLSHDVVRTVSGSFAAFAAEIARSSLYIGYDSAGQHVAAAAGVPQIAIFRGFASERTLARWRPCSLGAAVVRADSASAGEVLGRVMAAVREMLEPCPSRNSTHTSD